MQQCSEPAASDRLNRIQRLLLQESDEGWAPSVDDAGQLLRKNPAMYQRVLNAASQLTRALVWPGAVVVPRRDKAFSLIAYEQVSDEPLSRAAHKVEVLWPASKCMLALDRSNPVTTTGWLTWTVNASQQSRPSSKVELRPVPLVDAEGRITVLSRSAVEGGMTRENFSSAPQAAALEKAALRNNLLGFASFVAYHRTSNRQYDRRFRAFVYLDIAVFRVLRLFQTGSRPGTPITSERLDHERSIEVHVPCIRWQPPGPVLCASPVSDATRALVDRAITTVMMRLLGKHRDHDHGSLSFFHWAADSLHSYAIVWERVPLLALTGRKLAAGSGLFVHPGVRSFARWYRFRPKWQEDLGIFGVRTILATLQPAKISADPLKDTRAEMDKDRIGLMIEVMGTSMLAGGSTGEKQGITAMLKESIVLGPSERRGTKRMGILQFQVQRTWRESFEPWIFDLNIPVVLGITTGQRLTRDHPYHAFKQAGKE